MANILIEVDSVKSTIKVTLDDKKIPDVQDIHIYVAPWDNEHPLRIDVVSGKTDEESGVRTTLITSVAGENVENIEHGKLTEQLSKALGLMKSKNNV